MAYRIQQLSYDFAQGNATAVFFEQQGVKGSQITVVAPLQGPRPADVKDEEQAVKAAVRAALQGALAAL